MESVKFNIAVTVQLINSIFRSQADFYRIYADVVAIKINTFLDITGLYFVGFIKFCFGTENYLSFSACKNREA